MMPSLSPPLRSRTLMVLSALLIVLALCAITTQVRPSVASAQSYGSCSYLGSNYYWNGSTCAYSATGGSVTCTALGPNYYWNGASCVYSVTTTTNNCAALGTNYSWNGSSCVYSNTNSCASLGPNYIWNGSSCVYSAISTTATCSYLGTNYIWNGSSCVFSTTNNCSSLGPNYYWNGSSCAYTGTGTTSSCAYLGTNYVWNGSSCVPSTTTNCSYLGPNYYWNGSSCAYTGTTPYGTTGATVTYTPGWNIVAGPTGTMLTGTSSSLFSYPPGATSYLTLPATTPFQAGTGYWAYFNTPTTITLPAATASSVTVQLPAGQWVLVGNPGTGQATVGGVSATVFAYNPTAGGYSQATTIPAGQGAWAMSPTGGTLSISAGTAGGPPPPP